MNDAVAELDTERLRRMYRQMLRIREFEERVKATFTEHPGVIRGHTHLADGAEASIVGSLAALRPGDQVMATYRCHGYCPTNRRSPRRSGRCSVERAKGRGTTGGGCTRRAGGGDAPRFAAHGVRGRLILAF
jgi:TPP-dependent pyruvate/acetoin dehydrogenase alpha subunit